MVISFTGAQSTGKSTLLNECKKLNLPVTYVDEVTRYVKRTYNVPINEHAGDVTQLLILNQHLTNSFIAGDVIMDRCIIDGLVYTEWLYKKNKVSAWVYNYAWNLFSVLLQKIDLVFYCSADFDLVDDGERSTDVDFRKQIVAAMEYKIHNWCKPEQLVELSGTVEQRMQTIKQTLNKYGIR
jgi:nicotinamide riboside kinase